MRMRASVAIGVMMVAASAWPQVRVPTAPMAGAKAVKVRDGKYGVSFRVSPGWSYAKKDGVVSTFRLDARTASAAAKMRGVASMEFNPLPQTTLAGATLYYSVEPKAGEAECALQASSQRGRAEVVSIGGMEFTHGHEEHGGICVEARDEVYTAYRKRSCYRFDMVVNTFCQASSGAEEMSDNQLRSVLARMTEMLSSVEFKWEKSGPQVVSVPMASR